MSHPHFQANAYAMDLDDVTGELLLAWARQLRDHPKSPDTDLMRRQAEEVVRSLRNESGEPIRVATLSSASEPLRNSYRIFMEIIAENIANAETLGYKRSVVRLVIDELGAADFVVSKDFSQGELLHTGERLDIAINGAGFFVATLPDGQRAYTRTGYWRISDDGQWKPDGGWPVEDVPPLKGESVTDIQIQSDGAVTCRTTAGSLQFRLHLALFDNPSGLESIGGGYYRETAASGPCRIVKPKEGGAGAIYQGFLERSNSSLENEIQNLSRVHLVLRNELSGEAVKTSGR